ncbi:MAG: hypothetical protein C7B47_07935 [Sulfobacillus thermosulfidooxidans]|uniref:Uncharacterized protein n=1 Tax=Sulfobacillus thermosulfidooxidans TaxID=28034 RepID=A0A2T2WZ34_SULTH|nr:MAG: hypothetical protein C7B47_07935 [Sulfobacillus thermosulfidooxidans]
MCTPWSKSLLMLGVMASFANPWFIIIAIYPLAASLLARALHRNIWPAQTSCRLPPYGPSKKSGTSSERVGESCH